MSAVPSRLRGEQLTLAYGNKTIAESLNVTIPDGHFTAIIGPNGCGKSTLLRTLSRLMTPASGHVWLDGAQIQQYASKEVARRIGLLAQNAHHPWRYHGAGAGGPRALSAPAAVYPLAQRR
ncbi:ferric enterobactin transport ATP-binding protein FepC [Klebsiella pneumoniae subsp. ozaenae]|uniref:Ferric enterobactin transport ATP-binding protein FepC n=1 Tax=Klebsiella pneumoniae subsp. ozaenae TaxID=574 RepID=A0A377Z6B4_KLEPO|nr:ferric enterobactin transport ATP-binding protein FepC [Klebsiella pneumoniae subsp. ozaenae]